MYGGLKKSASRLALVAAAGVLSTGAYAADLGGDCCADLEERVAELEATTARKGNRKVSLTISGQVNRTIMYWNDGSRSNTFFGIDNTNSSTRLQFSGNAKVSPTVTAGYSIVFDVADNARSSSVSQRSEDASSLRAGSSQAAANADHLLRLRDANVWLESSQLGRITMGRLTTSGPTGTLDLGGIGVVASAGEGCIGTSLLFRNAATNALTSTTIGGVSMGCAHPTFRGEGIRYNSPTFAGFTFSASIAEAGKIENPAENASTVGPTGTNLNGNGPIGRNYGADLRYAGEFSGVRVAASIGYERSEMNEDDGVSLNSRYTQFGGALSLLHVPTGLFVQGDYIVTKGASAQFVEVLPTIGATSITQGSRTFSGNYDPENEADRWHVQAGIRQNFFGIGATSLYGEYGKQNGWQAIQGTTTGIKGSDSLTIWGLGMVQSVDAAAMDLYVGYRNYSASGLAGGVTVKDIDVVAAGARIRF
jgi:hypothetical protein